MTVFNMQTTAPGSKQDTWSKVELARDSKADGFCSSYIPDELALGRFFPDSIPFLVRWQQVFELPVERGIERL